MKFKLLENDVRREQLIHTSIPWIQEGHLSVNGERMIKCKEACLTVIQLDKISIRTKYPDRPNFNQIFLAHLSQRLIGELIGYSWSGVRPSSFRRCSQCSKIFSKTAWPIKAKFYVEPPWVGGTKVCLRHLGHMTKMAATPIYGKNPSKIFFSRTGRPIFTKLGM